MWKECWENRLDGADLRNFNKDVSLLDRDLLKTHCSSASSFSASYLRLKTNKVSNKLYKPKFSFKEKWSCSGMKIKAKQPKRSGSLWTLIVEKVSFSNSIKIFAEGIMVYRDLDDWESWQTYSDQDSFGDMNVPHRIPKSQMITSAYPFEDLKLSKIYVTYLFGPVCWLNLAILKTNLLMSWADKQLSLSKKTLFFPITSTLNLLVILSNMKRSLFSLLQMSLLWDNRSIILSYFLNQQCGWLSQ